MSLQSALEASLKADSSGATAVGVVAQVLEAHGIRSLLVLADDVNTAPCVVTTVQKRDITHAMIQGLVFELLAHAGVKNPAPQANMAATFVVKFVAGLK